MINYYQPEIQPFLGEKKSGKNFEYYWSFEDGLWDVLKTKFGGKGVNFLVPDFYCSDVLDNIATHGHRYIYYRLDRYLDISVANLETYIQQYLPQVIIIFHPAGLDRSKLVKHVAKNWPKIMLIEDCVHQLIRPEKVKIYSNNHVVIDSLRKVSPFPGSRIFANKTLLDSLPKNTTKKLSYIISSQILYGIFRRVLKYGFYQNSERVVRFAHRKILKWHDNIIGNSEMGYRGDEKVLKDIQQIDYDKIEKIKQKQIDVYTKELARVFLKTNFYKIPVNELETKTMHVYPLGYDKTPDIRLEKYLSKNNMPVWFKFTDMPWSEKKGVVFLPLGPHISEKDIINLAGRLESFV